MSTLAGWIYSLAIPETVTVVCYSVDPIKILLRGVGILKLAPGCSVKTKDVLIPAATSQAGQSDVIYEPELHLNLMEISPVISKYHYLLKESTPVANQQLGLEVKMSTFETNSKTLDELEQELQEFAIQRHSRSHQSFLLYGCYGGIVLLSLLLALYLCRSPLKNGIDQLSQLICPRSKTQKIEVTRVRRRRSLQKPHSSIQPYEEIVLSQDKATGTIAAIAVDSCEIQKEQQKSATSEEYATPKIR